MEVLPAYCSIATAAIVLKSMDDCSMPKKEPAEGDACRRHDCCV